MSELRTEVQEILATKNKAEYDRLIEKYEGTEMTFNEGELIRAHYMHLGVKLCMRRQRRKKAKFGSCLARHLKEKKEKIG